jgi:4-diphosphocytidyl-2-C-methyl-D-erythritol kinase
MKIKAYAKLNLSLNLLPDKLKNGLYPVKFINCQIDLCDFLEIKKAKTFPLEPDNLIHKAAKLLGVGAEVKLKKNIPMLGGLAGGSSDGAQTLKTLIKLYKLKVDEKQLNEYANKLGKDVCYCIKGGLCEVSGDGSKVKKINYKLPKLFLIIVYPKAIKPSTGYMYQNLDNKKIGKNLDKFKKIKLAIKNNPPVGEKKEIIKNLFNDFEELALEKFEELKIIKKDLEKNGADKAMLLGSGLGMAGFFENKSKRDEAWNRLKDKYSQIFKTETR